MKNPFLSLACTLLAFCGMVSTHGQVTNEGMANEISARQETNFARMVPGDFFTVTVAAQGIAGATSQL